jgi:hypothetical protein
MRVRKKENNSIRRIRHTKRWESFDGWFVNNDEGRIVFDLEYSVCWILVGRIELLIAGDDLEISKNR